VRTCSPRDLLGPLNDVEHKNAPDTLHVAGRIEVFDSGRRVSVVGTRKPTPEGIACAKALVQALTSRRMVVVSGLAAGIDTVAHMAALQGGCTLAVLGTPLAAFYPLENRALQERLAREQLLMSQFAPGTPWRRSNFPRRNRTMALLTDATVIVEAGESSGTLRQGWEALRLGRPLFLMEALTKDPRLRWPEEMIRYGAQVLSRDNLDVALDAIPERTRGELAF
jgi:DNA processing protein